MKKKSILVSRNQLLSQEINYCHKKSILDTRNQVLSQEINSYHKKSIFFTRNQFLWTHILWLKLFYQFATTRESYQKIRLSLYISWEPGSQVPKEFAALVCACVRVCVLACMSVCLYFANQPIDCWKSILFSPPLCSIIMLHLEWDLWPNLLITFYLQCLAIMILLEYNVNHNTNITTW